MSDLNSTASSLAISAGSEGHDDEFSLDNAMADALAEIGVSGNSGTGAGSTNSPEANAAAADQTAAAAADGQQSTQTSETPAAQADKAASAPDRWSAEDKAAFAALPPQAQALVQKRLGEMEADYTRKTQAASEAVKLSEGLNAIVDDGLRGRMQASGMDMVGGIKYLADLERFASTRPADYLRFVADHVRTMGIDPAKELGLTAGQGQADAGNAPLDPRITDLTNRLGQMQNHITQADQQRQADAARSEIEAFKTAKDAEGKPLRPYLAEVTADMAKLIRSDPTMTLESAYNFAVWGNETVRAKMQGGQQAAAEAKQRSEGVEAARALRQNVRPGARSMSKNVEIKDAGDAVDAAMAEVFGR